jgi:hypothetical protein
MQSKRQKGYAPLGEATNSQSTTSKHLSELDKLLSAAFDLMKRTPALERSAFEQLRQLRVRIRYALSSAGPGNIDAVPKTAPELFKNRKDESEGPIAFTQRVYSEWLGKNICRSDIKKLDPQLYNALYNLTDPGERLDKIGLPTKKQLNDKRHQTDAGSPTRHIFPKSYDLWFLRRETLADRRTPVGLYRCPGSLAPGPAVQIAPWSPRGVAWLRPFLCLIALEAKLTRAR